ncbi:MAG: DUF4307 domain-containing protein [Actinobacteria bacterium HGW-Actinobacteria-4]|nr:MAG: DUF4307 domain-containing protein [Actinobacteria bacterium HGW-Actinobacteria-4]
MMTNTGSAHYLSDDEDERSFARPPMSMRAKALSALGIAALVALASWIGWGQASQPVRWQDVGFTITPPGEAVATYDVFLYTDQPVTCRIKALSESFAEVGVATQKVDPADGSEQRFSTPVVTIHEATTAIVAYCEPDPAA